MGKIYAHNLRPGQRATVSGTPTVMDHRVAELGMIDGCPISLVHRLGDSIAIRVRDEATYVMDLDLASKINVKII